MADHPPPDRRFSRTALTKRTNSGWSLAIAIPYGSDVNGGPTSLVVGSCFCSPARIVSSVEIAATWPCCSITRQSVQSSTETGMGLDLAAAMLAIDVLPA